MGQVAVVASRIRTPAPVATTPSLDPFEDPATPVLRFDCRVVRARYLLLAGVLPGVELHYAVKANPTPQVLRTLAGLGARWDVASPGEIDAVLAVDPDPGHLSYGNPIKKAADIAAAGRLDRDLRRRGARLSTVNLGGGFPAGMLGRTKNASRYGGAIMRGVRLAFGDESPVLMAEPGRFLVADAGTLVSEVVLVSLRSGRRWVYLDAGLFTGLVEAYGESLRYRLAVERDGGTFSGEFDEAILAGPTCDSLDVLYQRHRYRMPADLRPGDRVHFLSAGAYTLSYSTVGFNGFAPLRVEFA